MFDVLIGHIIYVNMYCRMRKFNVPCPRVQLIRNHVLVMTFIGDGGTPAPKLKDVKLPTHDWQDAYEQVIKVCVLAYLLQHLILKIGTSFQLRFFCL